MDDDKRIEELKQSIDSLEQNSRRTFNSLTSIGRSEIGTRLALLELGLTSEDAIKSIQGHIRNGTPDIETAYCAAIHKLIELIAQKEDVIRVNKNVQRHFIGIALSFVRITEHCISLKLIHLVNKLTSIVLTVTSHTTKT